MLVNSISLKKALPHQCHAIYGERKTRILLENTVCTAYFDDDITIITHNFVIERYFAYSSRNFETKFTVNRSFYGAAHQWKF